jgi:glycine hydroxymethyltransferase
VTSGLRFGSPAITTRGFREAEVEHVGSLVADVLEKGTDNAVTERVAKEVKLLSYGGFSVTA